jgi:subtilisin family serine protease
MSVPKGKSAAALARAYAGNPNVSFAEPDYLVKAVLTPNDTYYSYQWAMPKISAPTAWDTNTGSSAITIAIVDTGIDSGHADIAGRVVGGYDYVNGDSNPADDNGHGTMCAGVAAANTDNAKGVAGLDWSARLLAVKVLDSSGSGYVSNVAKGVTYAADNGAQVISLSLGSSSDSSTLKSAVDYAYGKGSVLAAASGNDGTNAVSYPAAYGNVIAVGASDSNDALASFSNYGAAQDVVAPGVSIATTQMGGSYVYFSGTSAATPFVAALASLALSKNSGLANADVVAAIQLGAVDLGAAGWDEKYGWGRIDVARTMAAVPEPAYEPAPEPDPDTVSPSASITSPSNGATVSRTVTVKAAASDDVGVTRVDIFVDGVLIGSDTSAPYEVSWSTTKVPNGSHTLTAVAYDAAGNSAVSAGVTVKVSNKTTGGGKKK